MQFNIETPVKSASSSNLATPHLLRDSSVCKNSPILEWDAGVEQWKLKPYQYLPQTIQILKQLNYQFDTHNNNIEHLSPAINLQSQFSNLGSDSEQNHTPNKFDITDNNNSQHSAFQSIQIKSIQTIETKTVSVLHSDNNICNEQLESGGQKVHIFSLIPPNPNHNNSFNTTNYSEDFHSDSQIEPNNSISNTNPSNISTSSNSSSNISLTTELTPPAAILHYLSASSDRVTNDSQVSIPHNNSTTIINQKFARPTARRSRRYRSSRRTTPPISNQTHHNPANNGPSKANSSVDNLSSAKKAPSTTNRREYNVQKYMDSEEFSANEAADSSSSDSDSDLNDYFDYSKGLMKFPHHIAGSADQHSYSRTSNSTFDLPRIAIPASLRSNLDNYSD
jgi:hypothetical protein